MAITPPPAPMAQPLDIRVVFLPERGFIVEIDGREIITSGMGSDEVVWNVVLYLTNHLPSESGNMEQLQRAAIQMTMQLQNGRINANPRPERELANLFILRQMENCAPPTDGSECSFCLRSDPGQQWVKMRTCEHTFHRSCIEPWETPRCPNCNGDLMRNTRRRTT
jgi:hypothetical protein